MKTKTAPLFVFLAILSCAPGAGAKMKAATDFYGISLALTWAFEVSPDKGKFDGPGGGWTVYGVEEGDLDYVIEDSHGKRVYENTYKCMKSEYEAPEVQSCSVDIDTGRKVAPYDVQAGDHTLRMFMRGQEIYTLKFTVIVEIQESEGGKYVYITGDWPALGSMPLGKESYAKVDFFVGGGNETCGEAQEIDALVYRNGEFFAKGYSDQNGGMTMMCSPRVFTMKLYRENALHLSAWLKGEDILGADGDYEVRCYMNGKAMRTFAFKISGGKFSSAPPPASKLQEAILPENIAVPESGDMGWSTYWFYEKQP